MNQNDRKTQIPDELLPVIMKPNAAAGQFRPGLVLKDAVLVHANGTKIESDCLVDAGSFYYCGVNGITSTPARSVTDGIKLLTRHGFAKVEKNPKYYSARNKEIRRQIGAMRKSTDPTIGWRDISNLEHSMTEYKRTFLVTKPSTLLTVNKENVADIIDSSGQSMKIRGDQP